MIRDLDMSFEELKNDPRVLKAIDYVKERKALDEKYGLRPLNVLVNPGDVIMTRLGTIAGLKVEQDPSVPRGRIELR